MRFVFTYLVSAIWLSIAFAAVILHQDNGMDITCSNVFPENPHGHAECYQEEIGIHAERRNCYVGIADIKQLYSNKSSGTLNVEFELKPQSCRCARYELDFYIDENVVNAPESEMNISSSLLHSRTSLDILKDNTLEGRKISPCGKTANVTFKYVYTGWYLLSTAGEGCSGRVGNSSLPVFIETEYKKDLLINKKPTIVLQPIPALQLQLRLTVGYVGTMDLHMFQCDTLNSTCGSCDLRLYWEIALSPSGQLMCKVGEDMPDKPICLVESEAVRCIIQNITTGFYCVKVDIIDDRCLRDTVWNNESSCSHNSTIIEVMPASPSEDGSISVGMVAEVLVPLMIGFGGAFLICYCWRRRPSPDSGGCCFIERDVSHKPWILLLYARDCELYMNVMTTFRELLGEVMGCEVFDCFDPDASEELYQRKTKWLHKRISFPDVIVVLIESRCAVLQQMALLLQMARKQRTKVIYKDPTLPDIVFLYGLLALLKENKKVFVVRIQDFSEENVTFHHITPLFRCVMPQDTDELLIRLHTEGAVGNDLNLDQHSDRLQKLRDNISDLQVFKKQNGDDYLVKLLEPAVKE